MKSVTELINLPNFTKNEIREIFDSRHPFGPSGAHGFREHPEIAELVFSTENQIWREYLTRPRMIVGRKGAGKTSVLRQTQNSKVYKLVHRISTDDMITQCVSSLFEGPNDYHTVSAETAGKIWRQMINTSLMTELLKLDEVYDFARIERYFEFSGLTNDKMSSRYCEVCPRASIAQLLR